MKTGDFVMTNYPPGGMYHAYSDPKTTLVYITHKYRTEYYINYVCSTAEPRHPHPEFGSWQKELWSNVEENIRPATAHDMVEFLLNHILREECKHEFRAALLKKLKEQYGEPPKNVETDTSPVSGELSEKLLNGSNIPPTPTSDGKPGVAFVDWFDGENKFWVRLVNI